MVTMRRTIIASLAVALLLSFFSSIALRYYYTQCMPGTPVVQQNRVVPIAVFYGKTVYVTSGEKRTLHITYFSTGVMLVVYLLSYTWLNKKRTLKNP